MKVMVPFKNPKTGEIKQVKCGFNWIFFFFAGFLGLPLFLRGLNVWGGLFLVLWSINLLNNFPLEVQIPFIIIAFGLEIWIAVKGNEMVAKNYLNQGWVFAEPNSEFTKMAKQQWGIILENISLKPITDSVTVSSESKQEPSPAPSNTNMHYCHQCGMALQEDAAFCTHCGTPKSI